MKWWTKWLTWMHQRFGSIGFKQICLPEEKEKKGKFIKLFGIINILVYLWLKTMPRKYKGTM